MHQQFIVRFAPFAASREIPFHAKARSREAPVVVHDLGS
jgi:hypothetical protein